MEFRLAFKARSDVLGGTMSRAALPVLIAFALFVGGCQTTRSKLDILDSDLYFDFTPGFVEERETIRSSETRSEIYYFQGGYVRLASPREGGSYAPWSNVKSVVAESTSALSGIPADEDEVVEETIGAEHRFTLTQESEDVVAFGFAVMQKRTDGATWAWEPRAIEGVIRGRRTEATPEEIEEFGRYLIDRIHPLTQGTWIRNPTDAAITVLWGGVDGYFKGKITSSPDFEHSGAIDLVHSPSMMNCAGKYYGELMSAESGTAPWVISCPDGKMAKGRIANPLHADAYGHGIDLMEREVVISFDGTS